ncbi:DUF6240 domain-containing protein [Anaerocolumna cellulosilytica]|nr:DUF6240 domain-containing protein [Anaerocolumna cellulosilytica]MBB5196221.1 hypothetical protein [Anaerocolumna cellulosilytica]
MNINGINTNGNLNGIQNVTTVTCKDVEAVSTDKKGMEEMSKVSSVEPSIENTYTVYDEEALKAENKDKETEPAVADEKLENSVEQMTEKDYQTIVEEGISLEKYTLEQLERMLERVKSQRNSNADGVEAAKQLLEEKAEAVNKISNYTGINKKIAQKLKEANLPVTEENILKVAGSIGMAQAALQLSDQSIRYLVKNDLEPTIENIYKAKFSTAGIVGKSGQNPDKSGLAAYSTAGSNSADILLSESEWQGLQGQLKVILENAGLNTDLESMDMAKWMIIHKLPVNDNTLWSYLDLKEVTTQVNEEELLDKSIDALSQGKSPKTVSLSRKAELKVNKLIKAVDTISDKAIETVVKKREDSIQNISIKELYGAQQGLKEADSQKAEVLETSKTKAANDFDIKTIIVRRQLEEIRLKMTVEAGGKLLKKGFQLDTDSLSKVIDGLKEIEDQYYKNLLEESKVEVNTANTELLKNSLEGVEELKSMPSYILGSTLHNKNLETVNSLLSEGSNSKRVLANQTYEALMTRPRADMGDSIQKAFRNVDDILKDLDMETTQANERAVRILGYNNIPINEENVEAVKGYDAQVNYLMKNFHPAVAVELIRNGINPLNMPIEELNQQIDTVRNEIGVSDEEKYSRYLWKLEKNNEITEDEKKTCIGIYRLLNTVEKSDGAAVGAVIKAEQNITMKSLLTAVRSKKAGGMDEVINDSYGELEKLTFSRERITDQINSSFSAYSSEELSGYEENKKQYIDYLVKDIMENITPDKLMESGNADALLDMSIEKLHEMLTQKEELSSTDYAYLESKTEEFKNLIGNREASTKLLNNYELPVTVPNLIAAGELLGKGKTAFTQWKEYARDEMLQTDDTGKRELLKNTNLDINSISDSLTDAMSEPETIKNQYQVIEQSMNEILDSFYSNPLITSSDVNTLQRISYGMSFLSKMATKESYEIPLAVGDNITNVNVTVLRNTKEAGKVNIKMDSEILGNVGVNISIKDNKVNALLTCDNRAGLEELASKRESLSEEIIAAGLEISQINYGIGNIIGDSYRYNNHSGSKEETERTSDSQNKVNTNALYSLAKTFLVHIKEIELVNNL